MKASSNAVLKVLGMLLLTAAVLKGRQLLTEPVANSDIWSYRPFLVLTVEFELARAIWLLSGLFKKAAWLVGLVCFSLFSMITLYKAVTGAASRSRSIPGSDGSRNMKSASEIMLDSLAQLWQLELTICGLDNSSEKGGGLV